MENEKVSEKAVLDYDGYKSVRSMLLSESKADRDVGLGILQSIDEKKCLPFILFTAIEFSQMDEHIPRTVLWAMYSRVKSLNAISKIIDIKTKFLSDPFGYNKPDMIVKLVDDQSLNRHSDHSTRQYLDRIVERMSITQVVDAILIQDDPERFYPLEDDIENFIVNKLIKNPQIFHIYKVEIPGFEMKFNIRDAIEIRKHELNKK
jgi:hypothetical protein